MFIDEDTNKNLTFIDFIRGKNVGRNIQNLSVIEFGGSTT